MNIPLITNENKHRIILYDFVFPYYSYDDLVIVEHKREGVYENGIKTRKKIIEELIGKKILCVENKNNIYAIDEMNDLNNIEEKRRKLKKYFTLANVYKREEIFKLNLGNYTNILFLGKSYLLYLPVEGITFSMKIQESLNKEYYAPVFDTMLEKPIPIDFDYFVKSDSIFCFVYFSDHFFPIRESIYSSSKIEIQNRLNLLNNPLPLKIIKKICKIKRSIKE